MLDFFDPALARLRALPGIQDVAATTTLPFGSIHSTRVFSIEGRPWRGAADAQVTELESISSNYLRLMGISLIRGREFTEQDVESSPMVVIVSQSMAKAFWPNEDPIGHRVKFEAPDSPKYFPWMTIVGVVADVTLDWNNPGKGFMLYRPQRQWPRIYSAVAIRTSGNPESIVPAVRTAIAAVDPEQTLMTVKPMTQLIKEATISISYVTMMMSALGVLALLIAAVGLYGVMAYVVSESTHDIGIRMALGASPGNVLRLVIGRGMLLTAMGLLIGVPISLFWLHKLLGSFIIGIGPSDPVTLLEASGVLALVALLACWIPARLATRVDPLEALRYEARHRS
jgi:putative ABC transport system permease protein